MTMRIIFVLPDGERRACAAEEGQSLLKVAQANGIDLEGACEGSLACATCHVAIDPAWYGHLPPPGGDELAMLDLAKERTCTSRLGCQVKLREGLDGLITRLIKSA